MTNRKYIWTSLLLIVLFAFLGWYFLLGSPKSKHPFKFGLDLVGGTELVYQADTSKADDRLGAMESLKEVIERRVNLFGVSEPIVQTEHAGFISGSHIDRLIVELPGITNVEEAKKLIGQTPSLEFRLLKPGAEQLIASSTNPADLTFDQVFLPAELTGKDISHAQVQFGQTGEAAVGIQFTKEGAQKFARITKENVGKPLAIILDGKIIEQPVIREEIANGQAQISGGFTPDRAKSVVRDLNYGALPVPISFLNSETVGASLGEQALNAGLHAGLLGFIALAVFLILWYRLPGLIASLALSIYIVLSLVAFKLVGVTLTAAGIAGFILSIGMAVDANVLIFERTKEELKRGKNIVEALHEGFHRAWLSIRDSNISSIITAVVLFWLGTAAVKGFALTLGLGVLISMFTAITVSRTFLFAIAPKGDSGLKRFLFSNGFHVK